MLSQLFMLHCGSDCIQVYYMDSTFTMGHVVIRWKKYVVGNEEPDVHLFRCIQSMNPTYSFNTCYTGGESASSLLPSTDKLQSISC